MNRSSLRRLIVVLFLFFVLLPLQLINCLALLLDELIFPFRRIEPDRPLFVTGIPRSGTTFLHRLLMLEQPELTTFRLWELLFAPAICQKLVFVGIGRVDQLLGRPLFHFVRLVERMALGGLDAIHGTSLFDPEEDYLSLIPFGGCFLLVHLFPFSDDIWHLVEPWPPENTSDSRKRLMANYRGMVQRHLFVFGREKTFVSKNPSFTPLVLALYETFPSARVVGCFRDPEQAIPSLLSSMESGAALVGNGNNPAFQQSLVQMAVEFYKCLATSSENRKEFKLVYFPELTQNPRQCLQQIYEEMGLNSFKFHEKLEKACLNATNYTSKHNYDANQFGLDMEKIRLELECTFEALLQNPLPPSH